MNPSVTTNLAEKDFPITSTDDSRSSPDKDVRITVSSSKNSDDAPAISADTLSNNNDLTVTPAFPNFPTNQEVVIEPESVGHLPSSNKISEEEIPSSSLPKITHQSPSPPSSPSSSPSSPLLEELVYLLKPTNSLATPDATLQTTQEADSSIQRRTMQFDENAINNTNRILMAELTATETKSLSAAERLSIGTRGQRSSNTTPFSDRSRASSTHRTGSRYSHSRSLPTILIDQPKERSFLNHLSGLFWAFLAAYSFSIILFLTKICGIDLIFGFFLQMVLQVIAFGVYAFYKGYNLLGPVEHRIAMIFRALLVGIGTLTSFLAYYYITLPELSAIRQSQVVLTVILSVFLLHKRMTIARIIACILTILAVLILFRPTKFGISKSTEYNLTRYETSWIPYTSSWNHIIGISFVLCIAIAHSIASTLNKMYFNTQQLHNTVLCFWSALSALIISTVLVYITHFVIKNRQVFPHDWRLFLAFGLALASIFVFIANQKAIKRERSSIVTLIYSTDIIFALILENIFTYILNDSVIILGCLLILASVLIICIEVLIIERHNNTIRVTEVTAKGGQYTDFRKRSTLSTAQERLSI